MIYYNYIDPADARPGDYMFCQNSPENTGLNLCLLIVNPHEINIWHKVTTFYYCDHESDIVDGKPTPALIARFTSPDELSACVKDRKNQQLEIGSGSLVKVPGGIIQISEVKEIEGDRYYFGTMNWCERWDGEYLREYAYSTKGRAETERARLIEWLEGA